MEFFFCFIFVFIINNFLILLHVGPAVAVRCYTDLQKTKVSSQTLIFPYIIFYMLFFQSVPNIFSIFLHISHLLCIVGLASSCCNFLFPLWCHSVVIVCSMRIAKFLMIHFKAPPFIKKNISIKYLLCGYMDWRDSRKVGNAYFEIPTFPFSRLNHEAPWKWQTMLVFISESFCGVRSQYGLRQDF